jgi:hypothetical protein
MPAPKPSRRLPLEDYAIEILPSNQGWMVTWRGHRPSRRYPRGANRCEIDLASIGID